MQRLNDIFGKELFTLRIEEDILDNDIIDKGFFLEVCAIRNGKEISYYRFIDEDITWETLLSLFENEGSIYDGTLTVSIIPNFEPMFQTIREQSIPISLELLMIKYLVS